MTSVRPKLKSDTPKAVTAWATRTGRSVWMRQDGTWSENVGEAAPFQGAEAEVRLAEAMGQEAVVTDPYFMEVTESGRIAGRETIRETIRATGPTFIFGEGI